MPRHPPTRGPRARSASRSRRGSGRSSSRHPTREPRLRHPVPPSQRNAQSPSCDGFASQRTARRRSTRLTRSPPSLLGDRKPGRRASDRTKRPSYSRSVAPKRSDAAATPASFASVASAAVSVRSAARKRSANVRLFDPSGTTGAAVVVDQPHRLEQLARALGERCAHLGGGDVRADHERDVLRRGRVARQRRRRRPSRPRARG